VRHLTQTLVLLPQNFVGYLTTGVRRCSPKHPVDDTANELLLLIDKHQTGWVLSSCAFVHPRHV
jgi:hypothetical protein